MYANQCYLISPKPLVCFYCGFDLIGTCNLMLGNNAPGGAAVVNICVNRLILTIKTIKI